MNYTVKINILSNKQVFMIDEYKNMEQIVKHITSEQLYQKITESVIRSINEDIEGIGTPSRITAQEVIEALKKQPHEMEDYDENYYSLGVPVGNEMVCVDVYYKVNFTITPYRAATYLQPEEGGDAEFYDFTITKIELSDADDNKIPMTPDEQNAIIDEVAEDMTEDRLRSAYETQIENYDDRNWD